MLNCQDLIRRAAWMTTASLLIGLIAACDRSEEPRAPVGTRPVKLLTVERLPIKLEREFPGRVMALQSVDLSFRVSGRVTLLPTEGAKASRGDLLAAIDPRDYETNLRGIEAQIAQAKAQLAALRAGARPEDRIRLEAAVNAREAEYNEVQVREVRYRELLANGAASQQEYDLIKAQLDVAFSNLEAAKTQLEIGLRGAREEDIQAQEAAIMNLEAFRQQAVNAIEDTKLLAPFDGQVAAVYPDSFQDVQTKEPILKFEDVSQIRISIDVSERDMAVGSTLTMQEITDTVEAVATFTALPGRQFPVTVDSFETTADPVTQTFEITFVMDQPPGEGNPILPGMNATIRSVRAPREAEVVDLYVPAQAVFSAPDGTKLVWKVEDGRVRASPVSGDEITRGAMRITQGLQPGDTIAISGINTLAEGQQVRQMPDLKKL